MGNSIRRAGGYRIVLADAFNFVKESYEALSAMVEVVWCDSRPGLLEAIGNVDIAITEYAGFFRKR